MLHLFRIPSNWSIWDFGLFKWASIVFGIVVGAYISPFVKSYLWLFIVIFLLLVIRPMVLYFRQG
jgi:hypothetical protein